MTCLPVAAVLRYLDAADSCFSAPGTEPRSAVAMFAAGNGSFTVSFWFRQFLGQDGGDQFEYLFSTMANASRSNPAPGVMFSPGQIHVYLPESGHPAHGLVSLLRTWQTLM